MKINLFEYFINSKTGKARKSVYKNIIYIKYKILFKVQEPRPVSIYNYSKPKAVRFMANIIVVDGYTIIYIYTV